MGFTPAGRRFRQGHEERYCGSAVVKFLMENEKMSPKEIDDYLNKKSGVLGISGVSSDFRDLEAAVQQGNERAKLAIDVFCYRVKKYIGEYAAVMNGADAIIFTAGIGENTAVVREKSTSGLDYLGLEIDTEKTISGSGKGYKRRRGES